jgi:hypothetical protein
MSTMYQDYVVCVQDCISYITYSFGDRRDYLLIGLLDGRMLDYN